MEYEEVAGLLVPSGAVEGKEIRLYKARYVQLVLFCLVSVTNATLWITFAPITDSVESYYGVGAFGVNALSLVFMAAYIPMVFPAGWVLDGLPRHYGVPFGGLRWGMLLAAVGSALGACIRVIPPYWGCFAGQTIAAIAQPFVLNAPPMLAANWFPKEQRTMATTVCSVANPVGVAMGFVLPPILVQNDDLMPLLLVEAGIAVLVALLAVLFIREKPPTPPSLSAASETRNERALESLKTLVIDPNFWLLFLAFGFGLGSFNTLATLINQIVAPEGYNDQQSGVLGAMVVFAGLVGSGVAGAIVDKFRCYKAVLVVSFTLATLSTALFTLVLQEDQFWMVFIACTLIGLTMMPLLPISLELAVEITYPMREAMPSGLLMVQGQIVGIFLIVVMSELLKSDYTAPSWVVDNVHAACWVVVACTFVSLLLMLFFRGKLKRGDTEQADGKINA